METSKSGYVFRTISVGGLKLKNRLAVSPMVTVYCDPEGQATERYIAYHEARAKGGWGLIITEDYAVDPRGRGFWTAGLWEDGQIESHRELTRRVHDAGAKVVAQIYHCGRQTSSAIIGAQPVSASPLTCPVMGETPRELTMPEIQKIVSQFGDTALRAKKAGFDGVEVHGAHGYLIAQFMSKYSNKRCDIYGGSIANRARFPLEIISDIRKKCGEDFPIIFRISADERVPGGRGVEETKTIAMLLEKQGVDALHVSAGVYASAWAILPPLNVENGWITDYAEQVKKTVRIPVITVGRINDPLMAESILSSGKADIVAMGRGALADPELPLKYGQGRYGDIRSCIGCQQGCIAILFKNEPIRCLVNPSLGFEYKNELAKAERPKKVTVVGGGPAGMEAARAAALRGHHVTLYEEADRLGGQFGLAAIPPYKGDMAMYTRWISRQMGVIGIDVKLKTKYTADTYGEEKPDAIIIATGARPAKPPIPGIERSNVVTAEDVLQGRADIRQGVIIAGGGQTGAETATLIAATGRDVTIVEQLDDIAPDEENSRRMFLMRLLKEQGVTRLTRTRLVEILEDRVTLEREGKTFELDAGTIVIALGMEPDDGLAQQLKDEKNVFVVGDAKEIKSALEATREGYLAGCAI